MPKKRIMNKLEKCIAKRCGCPVFPANSLPPIVASPIKKKSKELCRGVNISKETNYVKFHGSTVRHLSVQGIKIKVLKKKDLKNWRYDAENGDQSQRVIHHFLRKSANK